MDFCNQDNMKIKNKIRNKVYLIYLYAFQTIFFFFKCSFVNKNVLLNLE